MRVGEFELNEPLPGLRNPHVIASLTPWIDAGSVGSLSLERLERFMGAEDLGGLATPGRYFDFTRYRPVMYFESGKRQMKVPNADLRYAKGPGDNDFLFLHMLEPHANAEEYVDAVTGMLEHLQVSRYLRIGAMYDAVPHTRPLLIMGTRNGEAMEGVQGVQGNRRRPYQGPTSIMNMVGDNMTNQGIESMMLMCRLPHYVELEADFAGRTKMLQVLCGLYGLPEEYWVSRRDQYQYDRISAEMDKNSQMKTLVERLETEYDARKARREGRQASPPEQEQAEEQQLPPSVEQFLRELNASSSEEDSQS